MASVKVYSPRPVQFAEPEGEAVAAPERHSLVGAVVGIVDNGKMLKLGEAIERRLLALGAAEVRRFRAPRYTDLATAEFLDDIAANVAGAVTGLGN
ncbi:MAG: hypothetical protein JWO37_1762 [Acidimicrobiales bacterium]|nr:hypothetical protein [Acidimicrobiales bacterium]